MMLGVSDAALTALAIGQGLLVDVDPIIASCADRLDYRDGTEMAGLVMLYYQSNTLIFIIELIIPLRA
jgi:hypothetical protein